MSDTADILEGFIEVATDNQNSFEPRPYINASTGEDSATSISIMGGKWIKAKTTVVFVKQENIGDATNKYIIANFVSGLIEAVAIAPDETDTDKVLLVELIYETFTIDPDEYPDNPPYEGDEVIVSWVQHQYGDIIELLHPDGVDFVIETEPRVKSLDFITIGDHIRELQDRQVYERLVGSGEYFDEDIALGFFNVHPSATTQKDYAYLDTPGKDAGHDCGKSIELLGIRIQLKDFHDITAYTENKDMDTLVSTYQVLVRDESSVELKYQRLFILAESGDLPSTITVGSASVGSGVRAARYDHVHEYNLPTYDDMGCPSEEWWGLCGHGGMSCEDVIACLEDWSHPHEDHAFNTDDHITDGVDRYIKNDGDATRNNMSGVIGDYSNLDSIQPNARQLMGVDGTIVSVDWGNRYLKESTVGNIVVDWELQQLFDNNMNLTFDWNSRIIDTIQGDWTVNNHGHFIIENTDAGTASNTGCLQIAGGFSAGAACFISDGSQTVYICDGTVGVYVTGGGQSAYLCDGTNAVMGNANGAYAYLCTPSMAGEFVKTPQAVWLCDGTYAVNTTGIINTDTNYAVGTVAGITTTKSFEDVNNQIHTVTITGGIITDWAIA